MNKDEKIHRGSGNVFADIGVSHSERVFARAQIMSRISEIINERGLTQKEASKLLNLPQSKISCLMNGKLSMFSLDHLFELLNALDQDVEIIIKPKTKNEKVATTHVLLAPSFWNREKRRGQRELNESVFRNLWVSDPDPAKKRRDGINSPIKLTFLALLVHKFGAHLWMNTYDRHS